MRRGKPEKYIALAEAIRQLAEGRRLRRGDPLPPERRLAEEFQCSQLTVRKALRLLEQDKLIHKVPSRGNYLGPAPAARREPRLVGFLCPEDELYYYRIFAALEPALAALDLHMVVHITGAAPKERELLSWFERAGAACVIAAPDPGCLEDYRKLAIPALFYDRELPAAGGPGVVSDDAGGAAALTEYLLSIGHTDFSYVGGYGDPTAAARLDGCRGVLRRRGVEVPEARVLRLAATRESGYHAAEELLGRRDPPGVIMCGNDTIAAGVVRYCSSRGVRIPEELSVTGFGDTEVAGDLHLTSVGQHPEKIAAMLADGVRGMIAGEELPVKSIVPTELVVRGSTAPPRLPRSPK